MQKYKITLSYDGTDYAGWQVQPNQPTIQATLQRAILEITGQTTPVVGSGRTDAGVHAAGQIAHFSLTATYSPEELLSALNAYLAPAIRILHIAAVPSSFHARYSALKKTYVYSLDLAPTQNPLFRRFKTHFRWPFDRELFEKALHCFIGTKNFTSFANESHKGAAAHCPVKTLYTAQCTQRESTLNVTFEGDGFLYKMVRNLMGTALAVAQHKLPLHAIAQLFAAENRSLAPPPAPAKGLCLVAVDYSPPS